MSVHDDFNTDAVSSGKRFKSVGVTGRSVLNGSTVNFPLHSKIAVCILLISKYPCSLHIIKNSLKSSLTFFIFFLYNFPLFKSIVGEPLIYFLSFGILFVIIFSTIATALYIIIAIKGFHNKRIYTILTIFDFFQQHLT